MREYHLNGKATIFNAHICLSYSIFYLSTRRQQPGCFFRPSGSISNTFRHFYPITYSYRIASVSNFQSTRSLFHLSIICKSAHISLLHINNIVFSLSVIFDSRLYAQWMFMHIIWPFKVQNNAVVTSLQAPEGLVYVGHSVRASVHNHPTSDRCMPRTYFHWYFAWD